MSRAARLVLFMVGYWVAASFACVRYSNSDISAPPSIPVRVDSVTFIDIDSAFVSFFQEQRLRQAGHPVLPDQEAATCLYGILIGDTAHLAMVRPAKIQYASRDSVRYQRCPRPKADYFGKLQYLGIAHTHLNQTPCFFSATDTYSFYADPDALVDVLACHAGLVARTKDRVQ